MSTTCPAREQAPSRRAVRWILAGVGVLSVGIAAVGVFVPGLPTTVFLLGAAWCFADCPWLERKLIRNRLFAPFLGYLDRTDPVPLRSKLATIATMWLFVGLSILVFAWRDVMPTWISVVMACAACIGTVVIVRWDAAARQRVRLEPAREPT